MALVDYFLKIDEAKGESLDGKHKDEIQLESWSFGATQGGTMAFGGGGGAGKVQMQDFHFTMKVNKASPYLFQHCANGKHIKKATLSCRKAGEKQQDFLVWTFEDILVSSYQTSGSGHGDVLPMDQISLNFAKVEVEYKEQKVDGTLGGSHKKGYDLKKSESV
jgi:type VI secretion system secreted protein Hcp